MSIQSAKMNEEDFELNNLLNNINNENNLLNLQFMEVLRRGNDFRRRNRIRRRIDPMMEYNSRDFKRRFRLYKDEVEYLYNLIDGANTLEPMVIHYWPKISITSILMSVNSIHIRSLVQVLPCPE